MRSSSRELVITGSPCLHFSHRSISVIYLSETSTVLLLGQTDFHLVVFRWDIHRFIVLFALLPDCREEQYPCTRLYSVHKPCKQCLNNLCFYR
uniref:Uncharacterized protein n=1 Tax=Salarias fasciatus TaxID=181472 RepID=A0A672JDQ5_SALFA